MTKAEREDLLEQLAMLAMSQMAKPTNKQPWWLAPGVTVLGVTVALFGVKFTSTDSAELKQALAIANSERTSMKEDVRETKDRQSSLEYIFANVRQQCAAIGIQIDPKTGDVTIKRGR